MEHLSDLLKAVAYLSELPINENASVDLSYTQYGVTIYIHRPDGELVKYLADTRGNPERIVTLASGNASVRWPGLELFVSRDDFAVMVAAGVWEK